MCDCNINYLNLIKWVIPRYYYATDAERFIGIGEKGRGASELLIGVKQQ